MWPNDPVLLLLSRKKHPWLSTLILSCYLTITFVTILVALALLYLSLEIKLHTLWDLILLEPFLKTDNAILFSFSIVTIASAILGLISAFVYSQRGLLTSMGIILIIFHIVNIYVIIFRVQNFISASSLYYQLNKTMLNNPSDNFPLHIMQKSLSCCGIHHYYEWIDLYKVIPGSCCNNGTICNDNEPTLFEIGCFDVITKILQEAYKESIEIIITLDVFFVIILFTGYFYYAILQKTKQKKNMEFSVLPRIRTHANNQQIVSTLNSNIVQRGNNTIQNNSSNVHNSAHPTNQNNEPIYPYLSMPEPNI
ncbi:tetraspanin-3-like [Vespa velutina]|uniref:tetraspanin-3-like n=1 Tax=Vespa velutina TaxID=202808 RepID=UPI001FB43A89|nr:tetraspanin-3-like [Vespa velutina]